MNNAQSADQVKLAAQRANLQRLESSWSPRRSEAKPNQTAQRRFPNIAQGQQPAAIVKKVDVDSNAMQAFTSQYAYPSPYQESHRAELRSMRTNQGP